MILSPIDTHYPFYKIDEERGRPHLVGSGVLFKINNYYVLLSAAHVFEELGGLISFPVAGVEQSVRVPVVTTGWTSKNESNDLVDLGIALLPIEVATLLNQRFTFIQLDDIDPLDSFDASKKYSFSGFPGTRITPNFETHTIDLDYFEYRLDSVSLVQKPTTPWHPALHVAGQFRRTEMCVAGGPRITAPEPNGISGGGVWTCSEDGVYKLVGIGTNWDKRNNLMIGTRIGASFSLIENAIPQLRGSLPRDPRIQIKLKAT